MDQKRLHEKLSNGGWHHTSKELHQWIDTAIERMKEKSGFQKGGEYPTFTEREKLASRLGKEMEGFLLEKNVKNDVALQKFLQEEKHPCPHCQRPSKRAKDKKGKPKNIDLVLKTESGEIPLEAPVYSCWKCRKSFSPLERILPQRLSRI